MQEIVVPYIKPTHPKSIRVFSIEGCNGAGKTTLLNRYMKDHPDTECRLCVPDIYQTAKDIKQFMLFESTPLCSALYYLGGAVEVCCQHNNNYSKILYDRSVWSTFAAVYAKDETLLPTLFNCLESIKNKIFLPDYIFVLDATYETCKARSNNKSHGGEFDKDEVLTFNKKRHFYQLLKDAGYPLSFLDVNNKSAEEVYTTFLQVAGYLK